MAGEQEQTGNHGRWQLTDRAAFGWLAVVTVLLFWKAVFLGRVLYWGDLMLQFLPWREYSNRALAAGELPLWNPYSLCGEPFIANPQTAVFYPWNVLGLLLSPERCLTWGALVHTLLVAWGMYVFLKALRLANSSALLGALTFAFSGFIVSRQQFPSLIDAVVWLPLALLWTLRVLDRPTAGRVTALGLVTALHLLAGHAQMSLFIFGLQVVCALMHWGARGAWNWRAVAGGGWVGLGIAAGCAAASVQLLPTAELVQHSTRAALSMDEVTRFSLPWWQLPAVLLPTLFGSPAMGNYWGAGNFWEVCGYVGTAPLLLAICGLIRSRRPERWVLGGVLVVGLLLAAGRYGPWYGWAAEAFPFMRLFRDPARFLLVCTFALAVLAAFGLEALTQESVRQTGDLFRKLTYGFSAMCGVACVVALSGGSLVRRVFGSLFAFCLEDGGKSAPPEALDTLTRGALVGVQLALVLGIVWLGLICLLVRALARQQAAWATAALPLLCLTALELALNGMPLNPMTDAKLLSVRPTVTERMQSTDGLFRCFTPLESVNEWWDQYANYVRYGKSDAATLNGAIQGFVPNLHVRERVNNASGYNPLRVRWLWEELRRAEELPDDPRSNSFLGVASVSEIVRFDPEGPEPKVVSRVPVYPRATLWSSGAVLANAPPTGVRRPKQPLEASFRANAVTVVCDSPRERTLVLSDTFYPGWHARIDGEPQPIRRAFVAFRAVEVPAGRHRVEYLYLPRSHRVGEYLTLFSWLCFALVGMRALVLRPTSATPRALVGRQNRNQIRSAKIEIRIKPQ